MGASRRREILAVLGYAVVIVATTPVVTRMLGIAWDDHGLAYDAVWGLTELLGVNIDFAVVVPAGFMLALLVLFALDEYKHVQAVLLVIGAVGFVATLVRMGKWTETIDWGQHWWGLFPGMLVGLVGLYGAKLPHQGRREFPAAARLLYGITATVVLVAFLEYHLAYGSGLGIQVRDIYLTAPASVLLLVAVGAFVQYSDRRDVVIIGGDGLAEAEFLGGLFAEARDRYGGVPLDTDSGGAAAFLNRAASARDRDSLPDRGGVETLAFKFTPGGFFSRQVVVTANRYDPPTERDVAALRERTAEDGSVVQPVVRALRRRLAVLVPRVVRVAVQSDTGRMTHRLASADTIILIAPMSDFVRTDRLDDGSFERWEDLVTDTPPHYASIYHDLCDIYARSDRSALVVATEAELAMRVYEEREQRYPSFRDTGFTTFVSDQVMTGDDAESGTCEVVAIDRNLGDDDEPAKGFDALLAELS